MIRNLFLSLFLSLFSGLLSSNLYSQTDSLSGNISPLIWVVDTLNNEFVVFYKNKTTVIMDGKAIHEKAIYVDIPIGMHYAGSKLGTYIREHVFKGENNETIIIESNVSKINKVIEFCYSTEPVYLKERNTSGDFDINGTNCFAGFFKEKEFTIYYYNVRKEDIKIFNKSIISIRKKQDRY